MVFSVSMEVKKTQKVCAVVAPCKSQFLAKERLSMDPKISVEEHVEENRVAINYVLAYSRLHAYTTRLVGLLIWGALIAVLFMKFRWIGLGAGLVCFLLFELYRLHGLITSFRSSFPDRFRNRPHYRRRGDNEWGIEKETAAEVGAASQEAKSEGGKVPDTDRQPVNERRIDANLVAERFATGEIATLTITIRLPASPVRGKFQGTVKLVILLYVWIRSRSLLVHALR
jgi:hypothetical protein